MFYSIPANANDKKERLFPAKFSSSETKLIAGKKNQVNAMRKFISIYTQLTGKKFLALTKKDIYHEDRYFEKFFVSEFCNAFFSFFSILSSCSYYEFSKYLKGSGGNYSLYLYTTSIFTVLLLTNLILHEIIELDYDKVRRLVSLKETLYSSGRWKVLIIKFFIFLPHPNALMGDYTVTSFNDQVKETVDRKLNSVLTLFVLLRFYFVIRFIIYMTSFMTPDANRICRLHFFETNIEFSIKCLIKNYPFISYFFAMIIGVFCFEVCIKIVESDIQESFANTWTCLWYIFVTMLTIGYGDTVAKTNEGRAIGMIISFFGMFIISMMIISINKKLEMSPSEVNSLIIINKIYINKKVEDAAKIVIYHISKTLNNRYINQRLYRESFRSLKNALNNFNEVFMEYKNFSGDNASFNMIYNLLFGEITNHEILHEDQLILYKKLRQVDKGLHKINKLYTLENEYDSNDSSLIYN